VRKSKTLIRKIIIGAIGFPLLVVGIILIPLPGPGLVVCFIAFFILSTEFEWANKYYEKAKTEIKKIFKKAWDNYEKAKNKE